MIILSFQADYMVGNIQYAKTIVDSTAIKTAIESTNLVENDYYKAFY